jgi:uncharacterized peroxidase-related enzyme
MNSAQSDKPFVFQFVQTLSGWPEYLASYMPCFRTTMGADSTLPRWVKESIAVVVSSANGSDAYCVPHHMRALAACAPAGRPAPARRASDETDPKMRLLLEYVAAVTRSPQTAQEHHDALREAGWTDREVLEATIVAAHFNLDNRIALTYRMELESELRG